MSENRSILFGLFVLVTIAAIIDCNMNEEGLKFLKRGIILKCQGNPVSCYGKRSMTKKSIDEPANSIENETEVDHEKELSYEKAIENLIESCKYGFDKSCSKILKIMLMNAN